MKVCILMKISLIISTYNRHDALELSLLSVKQQTLDHRLLNNCDIEVLIADDGSTSETRHLIEKFQKSFPFALTHVWHEDNGFRLSAIRNLAVSKSVGDYLIFIDGDCMIAKDFIQNQYNLMEKGFFVGGNRVLLSDTFTRKILVNKDISVVKVSLLHDVINKLLMRTNKLMPSLRLSSQGKWRKAHNNNWHRPKGCNMAVWRSDLYAVNGFDESFIGWGHEDADFLIRLLHLGVLIKDGRFSAPVYHLWHKQSPRDNEAQNQQMLLERTKSSVTKAEIGINSYDIK